MILIRLFSMYSIVYHEVLQFLRNLWNFINFLDDSYFVEMFEILVKTYFLLDLILIIFTCSPSWSQLTFYWHSSSHRMYEKVNAVRISSWLFDKCLEDSVFHLSSLVCKVCTFLVWRSKSPRLYQTSAVCQRVSRHTFPPVRNVTMSFLINQPSALSILFWYTLVGLMNVDWLQVYFSYVAVTEHMYWYKANNQWRIFPWRTFSTFRTRPGNIFNLNESVWRCVGRSANKSYLSSTYRRETLISFLSIKQNTDLNV